MPCRDAPRPRRTMPRLFPIPVLGLSLLLSWPAISLAQINPKPTLKEPTAHQVYQRGDDDQADIPIVLGEELGADESVHVTLLGATRSFQTGIYRDGKLRNVPTGGPYQIRITVSGKSDSDKPQGFGPVHSVTIGPVFVGDLWVLAGQSNMQGVGNLVDVTPPSDRVMALGMDGKWVKAVEPLHWLVDSPDPVHSGKPDDREARSKAEHRDRTKGAGLGLPFGVAMADATRVPVGLVVCAHGGTSMEQWDPAKKDQGGNSLYGSMLRQVKLAGGKVRGVLWYQGESDANATAGPKFAETFTRFIGAVRSDFEQPELPFYYVQIGRFTFAGDAQGWNIVRDAQRLIPDRVRGTAVVAAIDLELDDLIHVGTPGLKRLGGRLARIAQRELFGQAGGTTPTLERVTRRADNALVLKFKGVNRPSSAASSQSTGLAHFGGGFNTPPVVGLRPERHIAGFSIRKADGTEIPLIYDAAVGPLKDSVILKLTGAVPEGANLWYGYGLDPYCNLVDALDMAVPAFGPIALDEVK